MKAAEYLQKKKELLSKLNERPERDKCYTCYRPKHICLCDAIDPFETQAHFVLLMHIKEAKKEKLGTGRMTVATLKSSEIIVGVDFTNDKRVNELLSDPTYYPMVLYPGEKAFNVSEDDIGELNLPEGKKLLVFVIDGTWPCAKKMMTVSENIRPLPRLCFTPNKKSNFLIKHQPDKYCLSTLESIHFLLEEMDRAGLESLDGKQDALLKVFKKHVDFQLFCSTDPSVPSNRGVKRPSRPKEMKIIPKKNRKIIID